MKLLIGLTSVMAVVVVLGSVLVPIINDANVYDIKDVSLINTGTNMVKGDLEDDYTINIESLGIKEIVSSGDQTWAITEDGKLFGCGRNNKGQQGSPITNNVTTFTQRLADETIASVSCASRTTWVVTTDGKLFGCGDNGSWQQGDGTTTNVTTFTQRLADETIARVVAGSDMTWVVTTDGKLFGCGANGAGQFGNGTTTGVTTFTQRLEDETIANVFISSSTTWVVTTDGKLFGCGSNLYGQQGNGESNSNVYTFTQRLADETIASVATSGPMTWVVTTDGKLFGCGQNNKGQQGDGSTSSVTTFTQRLADETIASVATGGSATYAVTTDGKLFACGDNAQGQQGDGGINTTVTTFTQRLADETIASINVSGSIRAITTDGKLYTCGSNFYGQQGDGTTTNVTTFTQRLADETIASVARSSNTTWALTTDGKVFGCGENSYGQQGNGEQGANVTTFTQRLADKSTPTIQSFYVNDVAIETTGITSSGVIYLAGGDDWVLCINGSNCILYYAGLTDKMVLSAPTSLKFSGGSMTIDDDTDPTFTYSSIYYEGAGDYIMMGDSAYINNDTPIIGYAFPTDDSAVMVKGTNSALTITSIADGSITIGEGSTTTENTQYSAASLTDISVSYNTDDSVDCPFVIVPKTIPATEAVENPTVKGLFSAVPVMVIVAIMSGIIGIILFRRE